MATPDSRLRNRVRLDRALGELDALDAEFAQWIKRRRDGDPDGFHRSQLAAIEGVVLAASGRLRRVFGDVSVELPPDEVHRQAVLLEQRVAWVYRVWQHFRARFDQRDRDDSLPVLRAADEVVWSCFAPALRFLQIESPPPVPFIGYDYTPLAFLVSQIPAELQRDAGKLRDLISRMPCPEVSLPVACVRSPWWLVLVGHEVGHHVYVLLGLQEPFRQWLRALGDGGEAWSQVAEEVFADVYSVLAMGPAALRAIREFDVAGPADMALPRERYPSLAARLALLAETARALGCDAAAVADALGDVDLAALGASGARAKQDLSIARQVAGAVDATWTYGGRAFTLRDLVGGFDAGLFKAEPPVDPTRVHNQLSTARAVAAISLARWIDKAGVEDAAERLAALTELRRSTLDKLGRSGPEGERPARDEPPVEMDEALGELLSAWDLRSDEIG